MIENLLAKIFPPKLPSIEEARERVSCMQPENYGDGIVRRGTKQYRDGIERHFAEAQ